MPKVQKPAHDEESLHCHTIHSFASSKSSFWLQLRLQEIPHASHAETEVKRCLRRKQRRAALAAWVRCEPSTPRRDLRINRPDNSIQTLGG